jgi:hypothetical protein
MKQKELKTKLSRLQSKAFNLQSDLQLLIADLDKGDFGSSGTQGDEVGEPKNSDTNRDSVVPEPKKHSAGNEFPRMVKKRGGGE